MNISWWCCFARGCTTPSVGQGINNLGTARCLLPFRLGNCHVRFKLELFLRRVRTFVPEEEKVLKKMILYLCAASSAAVCIWFETRNSRWTSCSTLTSHPWHPCNLATMQQWFVRNFRLHWHQHTWLHAISSAVCTVQYALTHTHAALMISAQAQYLSSLAASALQLWSSDNAFLSLLLAANLVLPQHADAWCPDALN